MMVQHPSPTEQEAPGDRGFCAFGGGFAGSFLGRVRARSGAARGSNVGLACTACAPHLVATFVLCAAQVLETLGPRCFCGLPRAASLIFRVGSDLGKLLV